MFEEPWYSWDNVEAEYHFNHLKESDLGFVFPLKIPNVSLNRINGIHWISKTIKLKYGDYIKLEFGPGRIREPRPYLTIGLNPSADPFCDIYYNLENGIPLLTETVSEIYSNQFLEHIHRDKFIFFMNEMWRVLVPGGTMHHVVPHYLGQWAFGDPTHYNWFSEQSFRYFCMREDGTPFVERFSDYGIEANFILENMKIRHALDIEVWMKKPES